MTKTMAEVVREHWSASTHTERKPFVDKCDGCGEVIFSWGDTTVADGSERLAAHQAAALTVAGFGLVADAKAEALEEAAASIASGGSISRWLCARAKVERSEG